MKVVRSFDCETLEEALELIKHTEALDALELDFSVHLRLEERKYKSILNGEQSETVYLVEIGLEGDE